MCCCCCCAKEKLFSSLTRIETELSTLNQKVDTFMQELDDLKSSVTKLATDVSNTISLGQTASNDLHARLDEANATIAALKAGDALTAAQLADLQTQLDGAKSAAIAMTAAVNDVDSTVTAAATNLGVPPTPAGTDTPAVA